MPRFHFNVVGGPAHLDDEGFDLPDAGTARRDLIRYSGDLLREYADKFGAEAWRLELTDEAGFIVFALRIEPWLGGIGNKLAKS